MDTHIQSVRESSRSITCPQRNCAIATFNCITRLLLLIFASICLLASISYSIDRFFSDSRIFNAQLCACVCAYAHSFFSLKPRDSLAFKLIEFRGSLRWNFLLQHSSRCICVCTVWMKKGKRNRKAECLRGGGFEIFFIPLLSIINFVRPLSLAVLFPPAGVDREKSYSRPLKRLFQPAHTRIYIHKQAQVSFPLCFSGSLFGFTSPSISFYFHCLSLSAE